MYDFYRKMVEDINSCHDCRLGASPGRVVDMGFYDRPLLLIGEAPGEWEERFELPFVGKSGKALLTILDSVGLSIESHCLVTNIVKCRPPENRNPKPGEVNACKKYLESQIYHFQGSVIVTLGSVPSKFLLDRKRFKMVEECGKWYFSPSPICGQRWVVPNYHPSALLYQQKLSPGSPRYKSWEAWMGIRRFLASEGYEVEDL